MKHRNLSKFISKVVDGSVEVSSLIKPVMKTEDEATHPNDEL